MSELRVGDTVLYHEHAYIVRGVSPMGATPKRVMLEDPETHDLVEAPAEDLRPYGKDEA